MSDIVIEEAERDYDCQLQLQSLINIIEECFEVLGVPGSPAPYRLDDLPSLVRSKMDNLMKELEMSKWMERQSNNRYEGYRLAVKDLCRE